MEVDDAQVDDRRRRRQCPAAEAVELSMCSGPKNGVLPSERIKRAWGQGSF